MRALVTGGAGYVGGFTARALLTAGHEVVVLDDLSRGHQEALPLDHPGLRLHVASLTDALDVLREEQVDAVLHFAAWSQVGESVIDPGRYYANNIGGSLALLEAMLARGVDRIVFSSSCSLYSPVAPMPLREDSPLDPQNPYAFTKHVTERMLADFCRAHGLRYVALRYFNAAGASSDGRHGEDHTPESHLIPRLLEVALGKRSHIDVLGDDYPTPDGTCVRDYVHVEDLAVAHMRALELLERDAVAGAPPRGHVYNLGTGRGHSVLEVLDAARRVSGHPIPAKTAARRPGDPPHLVATAEAAARDLGWRPRHVAIDAIVASAWAWHTRHPVGYASTRRHDDG